jgi:uncharacterized membrane protein YczE
MNTKIMKNTLYSVIAFLLLGLGISLQIKSGIGQSMLNAFASTLSDLFNLKVGTVLNILNMLFFITYFILRKARLNFKDIIQIIATIANGYIINFFVYIILGDLVIQSYIIKIITFIMGLCLASICLGVILAIEIIKFPLEGLCIVISKKLEKQLSTVRLGFDLFFLISTLIITFLTRNNLYIREGTILSILLLSRIMGSMYNFMKKRL